MTDNYDVFLQDKDSPLNRAWGVSRFDLMAQMQRGVVDTFNIRDASITNAKIGTAVIGTANIGTLSFNEISGGTAILGGTSNGNGVLSVKNQSGSEVVKADYSGLTVSNGSITITNASGSSVIDSSGIVSTTQFPFGTAYYLNAQEVAGTNNFSAGSTNIVLTRATNVMIFSTFEGWVLSPNPGGAHITLQCGTASVGEISNFGAGETINHYTLMGVVQVPAGTSPLNLRIWAGDGTVGVQAIYTMYVSLGR